MSGVPPRLDDALRARVRANLARFERRALHGPELRPAAVAAALVDDEAGRPCFLLTRRPPGLRRHGGQWALPGGALDPGETPEAAARRELGEELGLPLATDRVLGLLDDYATRSGFCITPVVLWGGPGAAIRPDPQEVAAAYRVPLADLERPGAPRFRTSPHSGRPLISLRLLGTRIHAPTAAILYQLREVALGGRPTRVAHLEQPVFAWR